jgi:outer membrane phospholipase A
MAYRPIYILVGPEVPNVKFQFSTKVPLLFPGGPDEPDPVFSNLYFGYTQMSLWDIQEPGAATIDTTYMPELFFATQTPPVDVPGFAATGVGLQTGFQHESNGRSRAASRNANYFYVQPTVFFGDRDALHGELAIKGRVFFATLRGNPDLEDYYGHAELFGAVRFGDGLHVTATGRLGDHPDRGAFQLDVTYPLRKLRLDAYLHLQYFNGYTESLLEYNKHHQAIRLGVSFVR